MYELITDRSLERFTLKPIDTRFTKLFDLYKKQIECF